MRPDPARVPLSAQFPPTGTGEIDPNTWRKIPGTEDPTKPLGAFQIDDGTEGVLYVPLNHQGANLPAALHGKVVWRWGANAWRTSFRTTPLLQLFPADVVGTDSRFTDSAFQATSPPIAAPGANEPVWRIARSGTGIGYLVRQAGGSLRFVVRTTELVSARLPQAVLQFDRVTDGSFASGTGWSQAIDPPG